jgi:hypothetical protein
MCPWESELERPNETERAPINGQRRWLTSLSFVTGNPGINLMEKPLKPHVTSRQPAFPFLSKAQPPFPTQTSLESAFDFWQQ